MQILNHPHLRQISGGCFDITSDILEKFEGCRIFEYWRKMYCPPHHFWPSMVWAG